MLVLTKYSTLQKATGWLPGSSLLSGDGIHSLIVGRYCIFSPILLTPYGGMAKNTHGITTGKIRLVSYMCAAYPVMNLMQDLGGPFSFETPLVWP